MRKGLFQSASGTLGWGDGNSFGHVFLLGRPKLTSKGDILRLLRRYGEFFGDPRVQLQERKVKFGPVGITDVCGPRISDVQRSSGEINSARPQILLSSARSQTMTKDNDGKDRPNGPLQEGRFDRRENDISMRGENGSSGGA